MNREYPAMTHAYDLFFWLFEVAMRFPKVSVDLLWLLEGVNEQCNKAYDEEMKKCSH